MSRAESKEARERTMAHPTLRASFLGGVLLASAGFLLAAKTPQKPLLELPVWTEVAAPSGRGVVKRHAATLKVTAKMLKDTKRWDLQYRRSLRYQLISLDRLIQMAPHHRSADVALLRFANGMIVPYQLKTKRRKGKEQVSVAVRVWSRDDGGWSRSFPPIQRSKKAFRDVRPLRFSGNKVVLGQPWHPLGPKSLPKAARGFHPWRHVDSLVGIALTTRKVHRKPFQWALRPKEKRGEKLFFALCQFCHGVRGAGASFGVDLVTPHPVYRYRRSMSLLWHLRYRSLTAVEHGAMMPAIRGMTRRDATALWYWLRAAALRSAPQKRQPPTTRPHKR